MLGSKTCSKSSKEVKSLELLLCKEKIKELNNSFFFITFVLGILVLGYFCKNEFDKCIEISRNIKELEPRSWIFLMYSFKEKEGFDNLKEKEEFKNKFDEYSKLDWENVSIRYE